MSVFLFKNGNNDPTRNSFDKYYIPLVETKDFNAIIFNKPFFLLTQKKNKKAIKCQEMLKNDDYTTGNVLDYLYHQINYEFIGIDLSRETNASIPHEINFIGKLEEDDGATMFFMAEEQ